MSSRKEQQTRGTSLWARAARSPWTVACVVAAVVVGPSAATASALDRANAAPPHSARKDGAPVPAAAAWPAAVVAPAHQTRTAGPRGSSW
ncbi:hypothetical protein [Streptomyces sp. IB201691-2A2]|uniref:hypothetical protein n=1 Tax=Streptomyces sp. IB201691-2A2 TaxID=2561920 RepID=UPI001180E70C|nr:hypothetical protein [Streptomyces sp. IB201691-2A2]TRO69134.1 hypothetical protein E4K73_00190 [Streptomyces sp. IB201691-2A2]